jgi:membrane protease YdiL (CAAX protease family)
MAPTPKPKKSVAATTEPLDYWRESARPLVALVFIAPMLAAYEGGMLLLGSAAPRNGADVWLRHWLDLVGFGQFFLLPAAACAILLAWHHTRGEPWKLRPGVLAGMSLESLLLGFLLLVLAQVQGSLLPMQTAASEVASSAEESLVARMVCYCGAGIYEELLFRLMLIPALAGLLQLAGAARGASLAAAVVLASVLFSAAHYRVFTSVGDEFAWFSFLFRVLAGLFFSVLFVRRGFGIAAGAHALYDVFVAILS